jgi:hypothetical protein
MSAGVRQAQLGRHLKSQEDQNREEEMGKKKINPQEH